MTCERTADRLPEWVAGVLDAAEASEVRAHVETCDACAAEAEVVRAIVAAPARTPPAGLEARLLEATRAAARNPDRTGDAATPLRRRGVPQWALGMAAVLVLALGTPLLMDRMTERGDADTDVGVTETEWVEEPVTSVWVSDDGLIAGAPVLETLTDEEIERLLEEMGA